MSAAACLSCGSEADLPHCPDAACPKCGNCVLGGYGLLGGGCGSYRLCASDGCGYFEKVQDEEAAAT